MHSLPAGRGRRARTLRRQQATASAAAAARRRTRSRASAPDKFSLFCLRLAAGPMAPQWMQQLADELAAAFALSELPAATCARLHRLLPGLRFAR